MYVCFYKDKLSTENLKHETWKKKNANMSGAGNQYNSSCLILILWSLLNEMKWKLTWQRNKKSKGQLLSTFDMPRIILRTESDKDFTLWIVKEALGKFLLPDIQNKMAQKIWINKLILKNGWTYTELTPVNT